MSYFGVTSDPAVFWSPAACRSPAPLWCRHSWCEACWTASVSWKPHRERLLACEKRNTIEWVKTNLTSPTGADAADTVWCKWWDPWALGEQNTNASVDRSMNEWERVTRKVKLTAPRDPFKVAQKGFEFLQFLRGRTFKQPTKHTEQIIWKAVSNISYSYPQSQSLCGAFGETQTCMNGSC